MPRGAKFAGAPKSRARGPTNPLLLERICGTMGETQTGRVGFPRFTVGAEKIFLSKKSLETLPLPQIGLILENTPRSVIEENYPKLLEVLEKERKLTTVIRGGARKLVNVTVRGLPRSQQTGRDAVRKLKFVNFTESDRISHGDRFLTKACSKELARLIKNPIFPGTSSTGYGITRDFLFPRAYLAFCGGKRLGRLGLGMKSIW